MKKALLYVANSLFLLGMMKTMEPNYDGYVLGNIYFDSLGNPTTMEVEKPNPDKEKYVPLDTRDVDVNKFLEETKSLENLALREEVMFAIKFAKESRDKQN